MVRIVPVARFALWGLLVGVAALIVSLAARATETSAGQLLNRVYRDAEGDHKYVVFVPATPPPTEGWPVIMYLHGASARGADGRAPLAAGLGPAVKKRAATFPFVAVFPQNENLHSRMLGGWSDEPDEADRALRILDEVEAQFPVDRRREMLTGVSMGAFGVWSVAARTPDRWAAIIPISGGGKPEYVQPLTKVPVWAFHAEDDQVVPLRESADLVHAIDAAGGRAYLSRLPRGGHNIGNTVFSQDAVFDWLLDPTRQPPAELDWEPLLSQSTPQNFDEEIPFVPGAEITEAIRLRIGRDLLEAWSYALPSQIPSDAVSGERGARMETTRAMGLPFRVTLGHIAYTGKVEQARMTPLPPDRMRIEIGLRNLTMTLCCSRIDGLLLSAEAGSMQVVIGHRQPVWLIAEVRPMVDQRRVRFELVASDFRIPPENWYVTAPSDVHVRPLPFLRDRISDQLVEGFYGRREEIEREVVAGIPRMIAQLEQRIETQTARTISFGRWPMPIWQPRFRFWPRQIVIDEDGLSLTLGATAASLSRQAAMPSLLRFDHRLPPAGGHSPGLELDVHGQVLEAFTSLLAASDVAQMNVLDLQGQAFHRFADRQFLEQAIPDLEHLPNDLELRSEVVLTQGVRLSDSAIRPVAESGSPSSRVTASLPQVRLAVSIRHPGERDWQPYVGFDLKLRQDFRFSLHKPGVQTRSLTFAAVGDLDLQRCTGQFADGDHPRRPELHTDLVATQFAQGWRESFQARGRELVIPDRAIARVPLRFEDIGWRDEQFRVQLHRAPTRLTNRSAEPLVYEVRGPDTVWSEALTLPPNRFHEFPSPYPLTWKQHTAAGDRIYTLPLGVLADFYAPTPNAEPDLYLVQEKSPPSNSPAADQ